MHYDRQEIAMLNGIDIGCGPALGLAVLPKSMWEVGEETPSGWPAAVTVRPDNWNMTLQPATYTIASGDTLSGLAATYLGSPARWREIWDMQPAARRLGQSPDVIAPGEVFLMPDEARDNLKAWLAAGKPTEKKPGVLTKKEKKKALALGKVRTFLPWVVGGAAGLGLLWLVSRRRTA